MRIPTRVFLVLIASATTTHFILLVLIASQEPQRFTVGTLPPSRTIVHSVLTRYTRTFY